MLSIEQVAKLCHEVNRAYCLALGDTSHKTWEEASDHVRDSARKGVEFVIKNPGATPEASHASWMREKYLQGWNWGPVKDEAAKTHPCFLPYEQLPVEQRAKDYIFGAVVRVTTDPVWNGYTITLDVGRDFTLEFGRPIVDNTSLRDKVFSNLNSALEDHAEVRTYTPEDLASDLIAYASDCENDKHADLVPICKEWLAMNQPK